MKRILTFLTTISILFSCAYAESIDISALSYEELVELIDQAQRQIFFSDEWQEVEVPAGTYLVGEDIPEGKWTITANETHAPTISLSILDESNNEHSYYPIYKEINGTMLIGTKHSFYSDGKASSVSWKMHNGQYFSVTNGNVIFTPYKGLGFVFKDQSDAESARSNTARDTQNQPANVGAQPDEQNPNLTAQIQQVENLLDARSMIIRELSASLSSANIRSTIDPNTGDIVLDSVLFFETGKSVIKEEGQELLNRILPVYLDILFRDKYTNYLEEIIIECHTDSAGSFQSNLKLSQDRALQIVLYSLNMPSLTPGQKLKLQDILSAKGCSYSDLVYDLNGNEDPNASSRIIIKFNLNDSEIINEIYSIANEI